MKNHAIYPGSFDPVTYGHLDLVRRAAALFDRLVIAVGHNPSKRPLFTAEERVTMIRAETSDLPNVEVDVFQGLAVDFARARGLNVVLRGLRTVSDFESEYAMALTNRSFAPEIESVFVMPGERWSYTSSRLIKEIVTGGGSVDNFVPPRVAKALRERLGPESRP